MGLGLHIEELADPDCCWRGDGTLSPNVKWFGRTSCFTWGRILSVEGSDGVSAYVEFSEAVTPVARDTLLGVWMISSSLTW